MYPMDIKHTQMLYVLNFELYLHKWDWYMYTLVNIETGTLPPIIMVQWNMTRTCTRNRSWGSPFLTSVIMGGRVYVHSGTLYNTLICLLDAWKKFRTKQKKTLKNKSKILGIDDHPTFLVGNRYNE